MFRVVRKESPNIHSDLFLGQTCMALTLELETLFLKALNTS